MWCVCPCIFQVPKIETKKTLLLSDEQIRQFEQLCECRMARMPIQYIVREWQFRDLMLKMEPPVFIPRPETEELVELILQQFDCKRTMRFVEVGCGTGAISLALLHQLPKVSLTYRVHLSLTFLHIIYSNSSMLWFSCSQQATGVAIDQSTMACELTTKNATNLGFIDALRVVKHKLTADSRLDEIEGSLDLIVSNPPYVLRDDLKKLEPEILLYEDLRALDGGPDGLSVIRDILTFASHKLRVKGMLWLEVEPSHPKQIEEYLAKHSELQLKFVASYKDMFHRERFVEMTKV